MERQSRRNFLKTTSLAAGAVPLTSSLIEAKETPKRPNLLFVLSDQWRFSSFGHSSDEIVRTPHIDRLAAEGVNFERAFAANPVCTPNRSCLLTGRHSHQHGMLTNNLMLPPSEICWPEMFADAGYATHYVGKWHMDGPAKPGFVPPGWRRRGLQTFEGFNRGHVYHKQWGFDNEGEPLHTSTDQIPNPYYEPILQTDLAMRFMDEHRNDPFCCYLSWGPPHTPFNPPKKFERYQAEEIIHRPNVPQEHRDRAAKQLAGYYGLCESLDHEMGRLMEFLKRTGLEDNTLVVFSSDHGELCGSHGKYRKGEPEEESLHVPLIMRLPGTIPAGVKSSTLINSIDLMPTLLSLCDLPDPGTCTGRDLSQAATTGKMDSEPESIYCEGKLTSAGQSWRTLVTNRYKMTVRGNWNKVEGLYDLQNDPFEMNNLIGSKQHRAEKKELLAELQRQAKETGDTFPNRPESAKPKYSDEEAARSRS